MRMSSSLPKLKTHKKAGITCALKNLIGINGNKEYLPHIASAARARRRLLPGRKSSEAFARIRARPRNSPARPALGKVWHGLGVQLERAARLAAIVSASKVRGPATTRCGAPRSISIALFYTARQTQLLGASRRVSSCTSRRGGGRSGDGPARARSVAVGLAAGSWNGAAGDGLGRRVSARLRSARVSIAREAFGHFRWPLAPLRQRSRCACAAIGEGARTNCSAHARSRFSSQHPAGWRDASARRQRATARTRQSKLVNSKLIAAN